MDYTALACLIWTCLAYYFGRKLHKRKPLMIFSPVVTVSVSTIALMLWLGISYDTYHLYTKGIVFLLTPVTVAFAVPIYENRQVILRQLPVLAISIAVGMFVGVSSAFVMAHWFHFSDEVTNSLMARSVSTPFAVVLAGSIHGSTALVSLFTIITGFIGMIFGDLFLAVSRVRFHVANGVAFGNAAHGFGTSRANQRNETEGVMAGLTMILAGLFMVVAGPSMVHLVVWMMHAFGW
ncbi:LrgB family protein [Neisseria perflava]|uniref:LrgB family protein n=1 Tax=Neisseria perflava TaxID=33053 RepID=UPI0020A126BF|nr:LrgB family protein [Neisseria perflava]MCP1771367.1 putative effector of murein hydrolase [Neisseria perflava]